MADPSPIEQPASGFTEQPPLLEMRFPPLPRTVAEVSRLKRGAGDEPDTPRLVELIETDPLMASAVLRRINSAYYALRAPVTEPSKAVFLLGFNEVCNIVLTAGMLKLRNVVNSDEQARIFGEIVKMGVGAAYYAQLLAEHLRLKGVRTAFTAGLLHNIGRLVLLYNRPTAYERLCTHTEAGLPTAEAEHLTFGIDHPTLGGQVAEHWRLADDVTELIRYHPRPGRIQNQPLRKLALVLAISVSATEQLCRPATDATVSPPPKTALRMLARAQNAPPDDIASFLEAQRTKVADYITSMINP